MNKEITTPQKKENIAQDIEGFLQELIGGNDLFVDKHRKTSGRKAILPALVLWSGVIIAVLRGFSSQLQIWRLVSWEGFWNYSQYPVTDQVVYNRLADERGKKQCKLFFYRVRDGLKERLAPTARRVNRSEENLTN